MTEGLTGVNLPSVQLQVAMGIPLYNIPEIRAMYGLGPGNSPIDFLKEQYIYPDRHVIAARITAGDRAHTTPLHPQGVGVFLCGRQWRHPRVRRLTGTPPAPTQPHPTPYTPQIHSLDIPHTLLRYPIC